MKIENDINFIIIYSQHQEPAPARSPPKCTVRKDPCITINRGFPDANPKRMANWDLLSSLKIQMKVKYNPTFANKLKQEEESAGLTRRPKPEELSAGL
jgi:hypothetical protein